MKKLFLILLLVTVLIAVQPTSAEIEPSYDIIFLTHNPTIAKGDELQLDVIISGYGNVTRNKFIVSCPNSFLDQNKPSYIQLGVNWDPITNEVLLGENAATIDEFTKYGMTGVLSKAIFYPAKRTSGIPLTYAEFYWNDYAPLSLYINSDPELKSGDYEVKIILHYEYKNKIYTTSDSTIIHVKNWQEEYDILILSGQIALGFFSYDAIKWLYNLIKENRNKINKESSEKCS